MTPDRLKEQLSEIPTPPAAHAREQAVAEARAEIAGRDTDARAARAWVGELVGIGDVGGPPTQEKHGGFMLADTAVVIDNGEAPDGSRYEWVAYRCHIRAEDGVGTDFKGIGVSLEWPGVRRHEGGGSCEELE